MATSAYQQTATTQQTLGRVISAGVKAGLGGGLVFGLMMGMIGMLPNGLRLQPALRAGVTAKQGGGGYRRLVCFRSRPVV